MRNWRTGPHRRQPPVGAGTLLVRAGSKLGERLLSAHSGWQSRRIHVGQPADCFLSRCRIDRSPRLCRLVHSGYMFEEFRGRGLFPVLLRDTYLTLWESGTRYVAALVDRNNTRSMVAPKFFSGVVRRPCPILIVPFLGPRVLGEGLRRLRDTTVELPRNG